MEYIEKRTEFAHKFKWDTNRIQLVRHRKIVFFFARGHNLLAIKSV